LFLGGAADVAALSAWLIGKYIGEKGVFGLLNVACVGAICGQGTNAVAVLVRESVCSF
jgi:hypothetical protein